ncbi:MoaD/ThiS family protein [Actinomadura harenae]|uniref:MoaD/ThiS family protein n=1 Tax=Actinomadura harenae TaxID=2483351 RepID=UPI0018F7324A|nr:MoaD/ThiS family protein [Actinomadura harenae]
MIRILIPSVWSPDGRTAFEGAEGPLPDVVRRFADDHPWIAGRLFGPDGAPLLHVNLVVDDELVPRRSRDAAVVGAGSTVTILAPMAGG